MNRREFLEASAAVGIGSILTGGLSIEGLATRDEKVNQNPPQLLFELPYSSETSLQNAFGAYPVENTSYIKSADLNFLGRAVLNSTGNPALSNIFLTPESQIITHEIGTKNIYQFSPLRIPQVDKTKVAGDPKYWRTYHWVSQGLKTVSELGIPLASYIPSHIPITVAKHFPIDKFVDPEEFINRFMGKKEFTSFYMLTEGGFIIDLAHASYYAEYFRIAKESIQSKQPVKLATTVSSAPLSFEIDYTSVNEDNLNTIALATLIHHAYLSEYTQEAGNRAWAGIPQKLKKLGALSNEDMHSNFIGINALIHCLEHQVEPTIENVALLIGQEYKSNREINPRYIPDELSAGIYPHLPVVIFRDQKPLDIESIREKTSIWNEILLQTQDILKVAGTNPYQAIFNKALGI